MKLIDKDLVWWRDVPVDVEWGLLDYLMENWNGRIYVVSANGFKDDRNAQDWETTQTEKITLVRGPAEIENNKELINDLLNRDAIHIFSGIKGGQRKFLNELRARHGKECNCALIMEMPSLYGSTLKKNVKKLLYPFIYGYYFHEYGFMFRAVFTMGMDAVKMYASYGWKRSCIFDFMYLPRLKESTVTTTERSAACRALYVGRFEYATKGLKTLMDAVEGIDKEMNWHLDFYGGYGAQKDEVIQWCNQTEHVEFKGRCPSDKVINLMAEYDFCIVPSLYDGWNMAPLQAICAGIGCIISDKAGSQELIENSGAGAVFPAGDINALQLLLSKGYSNLAVRENWKKKASQFKFKVANETVGEYFIQALRYSFGECNRQPICPWMEQ